MDDFTVNELKLATLRQAYIYYMKIRYSLLTMRDLCHIIIKQECPGMAPSGFWAGYSAN